MPSSVDICTMGNLVFTPDGSKPLYLLADFDVIRMEQTGYDDDRALVFDITDDHGRQYSHTEIFSPVDGVNILYDIREMLRPYFNRSDAPGLTGFDTTSLKLESHGNAVLHIKQYAQENLLFDQAYNVFYTDTPSGYAHTGAGGIGSRFLMRGNEVQLGLDNYAAVSWFPHGEYFKVKLLHYSDGVPVLSVARSYAGYQSNNFCTFNFTLRDLAESLDLDAEDVIYADLQLLTAVNGKETLLDSVRYMYDRRHRSQERTFAFIGPMGEPEFVTLTGKEQHDAEFLGTFLQAHNDYLKADTKLNRIHTSFTGPLSEGRKDLIWDMAASPWVYTIEDDQLIGVTITEVNLSDSLPRTEPVGLQVKWRYSGEYRQRIFRREPNTPHLGIFDRTFDDKYE